MDDKSLKSVLHRLPGVPARTRFCPDDGAIAKFYDGSLDGTVADTLRRHVADCTYCQYRVGLVARMEQDRSEPDVPEELLAAAKTFATKRQIHRPRAAPTWAAAAVIVLAISTAIIWNTPQNTVDTSSGPIDPVIDSPRQLRSIDRSVHTPEIVLPHVGAEVPADEVAVRWEPIRNALFYELYLMTDGGDLLVKHRLTETEWTIRQPALFIPGGEYFVRVEARLSDSNTVSSKHQPFRIAGGH